MLRRPARTGDTVAERSERPVGFVARKKVLQSANPAFGDPDAAPLGDRSPFVGNAQADDPAIVAVMMAHGVAVATVAPGVSSGTS